MKLPQDIADREVVLLDPMLATGNSTINLIDSEHRVFADNRRTQVDMRFAKVLKFGRTKTDIGVDLYNLLNTNYTTTYQGTYTTVAGQPLDVGLETAARRNRPTGP